jgi:hypothetical protein
MGLTVKSVDVWAAEIQDEPGGLAGKLAALAGAGADLDFIVARRCPDRPGAGVVFVTPLKSDAEIAAATEAGFTVTQSLHSVRIEGDNRAGIGAQLTEKLAQAGISLRGLSAAVTGVRFIMYLALDTAADADQAVQILQEA